MSNRTIGQTFLHSHPHTEREKQIDSKHVIIDRDDWIAVVDYLHLKGITVDQIHEHHERARLIHQVIPT